MFTNGRYDNNNNMRASQRALKDTHVPLNIVPKGAQAEAQLESLGRGRGRLVTRTPGLGWERWQEEKAAFPVKMSPQFQGQLQAGWSRWIRGQRAEPRQAGWDWGALHLAQVVGGWPSTPGAQRGSSLLHDSSASRSSVSAPARLPISGQTQLLSSGLCSWGLSIRMLISSLCLSPCREGECCFPSAALRHFRGWSVSGLLIHLLATGLCQLSSLLHAFRVPLSHHQPPSHPFLLPICLFCSVLSFLELDLLEFHLVFIFEAGFSITSIPVSLSSVLSRLPPAAAGPWSGTPGHGPAPLLPAGFYG